MNTDSDPQRTFATLLRVLDYSDPMTLVTDPRLMLPVVRAIRGEA